jgi:Bacterial Ig-like domain (group 2)
MRIQPKILSALMLTLSGCGGSSSTAPVVPPPGPSASLSIAISDPIEVGTAVQATATITDISGNVSQAPNVAWSSADPEVVSIDASGLVTGNRVGTGTIQATSGALTKSRLVIVKPGPPASVTIYSGDLQFGPHGSQLPAPLCVLVMDAHGNVLAGVVATYSVASGGGTLGTPTSPPTDAAGVATSGLWRLGSQLGEQTIVASVAGAGSVTFKATAQ